MIELFSKLGIIETLIYNYHKFDITEFHAVNLSYHHKLYSIHRLQTQKRNICHRKKETVHFVKELHFNHRDIYK